jgi:lysophospholipase L1-like esterase
MSEFLFQDGQTVVFAGDSITDAGRRAEHKPYGQGYVSQAIALIGARYPDRNITFHNAGIGGNTVVQLRDRWQDDVLYFKPDWITVKIGINDLHRMLVNSPDNVPPELFEAAYRDILSSARETGARLLLIDPFYISQETHDFSFRKKVLDILPEYIAIVHQMRDEFDALHVPTHDLYMQQLQRFPADYFCPEPVHPSPFGHLVITHGVLQELKW